MRVKFAPNLRLDLRDHDGQGVAVVRIARQRLGVSDELPAPRAMRCRGERDFHAELVGPMALTLADALDLGRMQRIDFSATLVLALLAHPMRQDERVSKDALQFGLALDLAQNVANDPAEISADRLQRPVGALKLFGVRVALMSSKRTLVSA